MKSASTFYPCFFSLLLCICICISSCSPIDKLESAADLFSDGSIAEDLQLDILLYDAMSITDEAIVALDTKEDEENPHCYTSIWDPNLNKLTLDFNEDCLIRELNHSGKIIITYSGGIDSPKAFPHKRGAKLRIDFDNYRVNDYNFFGTQYLENISESDTIDAKIYRLQQENIVMTNGSLSTQRNGEFTQTSNVADDTYIGLERKTWGQSTGVTAKGEDYQVEIMENNALLHSVNCLTQNFLMPSQGEKILRYQGHTRQINFGTGECNHSFNVKQGVFSITVDFTDGELPSEEE